jgi:hypothetical protein
MQENEQRFQTKQLVQDYIGWRLAHEGYSHWGISNRIDLNRNTKIRICMIMRQMAIEFEQKYNSDYMPLGQHFDFTPENIDVIFPLILAELFQIKPFRLELIDVNCEINNQYDINEMLFESNWCRIIALFSFSGCLSVRCYNEELPTSINTIEEWLIKFLNHDRRIFNWIKSKGGWVSKKKSIFFKSV